MLYEIECNNRSCKKRVWARVSASDEYEFPDDICEHIYEGDFSIIDQEEESDE